MNAVNYRAFEGVIQVEVVGAQDEESVLETKNEIEMMQKYVGLSPSETKLLINTRNAGMVYFSAIPASISFIDDLSYLAIAIIRDHGMMRTVVDSIIKHSHQRRRVCLFDDNQTALEWLRNLKVVPSAVA